eukprot:c36600_g1_i1 orf=38-205(+)
MPWLSSLYSTQLVDRSLLPDRAHRKLYNKVSEGLAAECCIPTGYSEITSCAVYPE